MVVILLALLAVVIIAMIFVGFAGKRENRHEPLGE
jgi:hypothetical protein